MINVAAAAEMGMAKSGAVNGHASI